LHSSQMFIDSVIDQNPYAIWIADEKGTLIRLNQACRDLLHITDDISGTYSVLYDDIIIEKGMLPLLRRVFDNGETARFTISHDAPRLQKRLSKETDNRIYDVTIFPIKDNHGRMTHAAAQFVDITDQKRADETLWRKRNKLHNKKMEEALRRSEYKFRDLMEEAPIGFIIVNTSGVIEYVNKKIEEISGWTRAELIGRNGLTSGIFDEETRNILMERLAKRLAGDPPMTMEVPVFCKDGRQLWVEIRTTLIYQEGVPVFAQITMMNVTERKRFEDKVKISSDQLRRAMIGTVQAVMTTIEYRDPYTAGHQKRVADLAVAIAEEMGLPEEQVEGIRIAGLVHDVGKIYIPSEILSRPGDLSPLEYSLVQLHAQASYDIIKDIEFPCPIGKAVLQHHERIDGSGYPAGLRGEDIVLEARIIAVADVIESMATHRPYRPALGVDAALGEIIQNRGILFDSEVVNVCVNLFKEKNYRIEDSLNPPAKEALPRSPSRFRSDDQR